MATTQLAFGKAGFAGDADVSSMLRKTIVSETMTPTATTATSVNAALGAVGSVVRIATDTLIYASFGPTPNAQTDANRLMIPANTVELVFIEPGDKVAIVTAP